MSNTDPTTQAEQIVLGTAMLSAATVAELAGIVTADDFHRPAHVIIWQAIAAQHDQDAPTDPAAVAVALAASKELGKVGGAPYLATLLGMAPTAANGPYYARLVAEAAERRRVAAVGTRLAQAADKPETDLAALVAETRDHLTDNDEAEWPDPVPLASVRDLPTFPAAVLPDWLGEMADATAIATQTPVDLSGSLILACLSAATLGRAIVEPSPGWCEQTSLFTCVALGPGNRKSTVFDILTRPIRDAEAVLAEELRPKVIEARTEKALAVASNEAGNPDAVNNAKTAAREAEELVVPAEPRLLADDITPEATKTLLAEQGGRLAVMSAEGGIFATIAGRYSGVPDLDVFLKGHAGDMLRVTRKSAPVEHVERPALTVGLAVQPSVLRDIGAIPGFEDRGLLARFLFALPASTVGSRCASPPAIPGAVRETYNSRLRQLAAIMWHATDTTLTLTDDARDRVISLEREREPKLAPGGEWEPILNWANKWTGAVVRIAGLLHIADNLGTGWRTPIAADTIDAAAHIGYYYAHHALAVWDYMGTDTTGPAHRLLAWLQQQRQPRWSKRDIHRALHRRLSLDELDAGLRVLSDHGHVRVHQPRRSGRGRRPAPRILVHPHHTGGAQ
ncbi:DUF3987 domain-containing protein [Stackebrandtia nassauensis]|uniref:DnaB domain protein helicase domain protein n=1 Tax=Stackebrandtia nassauensis (strain DSM 44728 / CIP 108903 / NRRL B-16338 / NBRC 102104 / LLR-40K-21) TaxID=446470 RepID=D3Q975_STANL|nr:DUF3987 domain-containing protein [Stackebrandtia nassauensis]ADD40684.1 DnaB domain protein helicase domain protein [Stackebrandtia nassauensis DSM 44728]